MMKHRYLSAVALLLGVLLNPGASAAEFREITWDDLVPAAAEFDDPFTRLDEDTLFELSLAVQIRDEIEAGNKVSDETMANYKRRVEDLQEQGVDIDGLIVTGGKNGVELLDAGVRPFKLHSTRHTWATFALKAGKSVR